MFAPRGPKMKIIIAGIRLVSLHRPCQRLPDRKLLKRMRCRTNVPASVAQGFGRYGP